MMSGLSSQPMDVEGSALATRGADLTSNKRKKPWCDLCKLHCHTKESYWKLHGKPPNWQPGWNKKLEDDKALNTVS